MATKAKKVVRTPLAELEDLRDDCIAVVRNSGLNFKQVRERGGPTPQTTARWLYRETRFPQLATVRAMLRAVDYELSVTPNSEFTPRRFNPTGEDYPGMKDRKTRTRAKLSRQRYAASGSKLSAKK